MKNTNDIKVFSYQDNEVRTIQENGETYWVLKDVCDVLGIQNATDVAKRLDEDEVTRFNLGGLSGESNIVNESGLYNVILRSDKPEAKAFKRWVTHEVLPSIRKTGAYAAPLSPLEQLQLQVKIMQDLEQKQQEQQQALEATNQRLDTIGEIISLNPTAWREESRKIIARIAEALGGFSYIQELQADIYKLMRERFGIDVKARLTNLRRRMAEEGASTTKRSKTNYLDAIANDKRAVEAYLTIIKEMSIMHGLDKPA